ncbi:nuclease-related domain-containing protein [Clostridium sp.]|uniref:nuclease-related domain-containing protein n=1 Tax=Clostridium sp. TaxID=1506 RepID=UPI003216BE48
MSFLKNFLGIKYVNSHIYYKEFTTGNSQLKDLEELSERVKNKNKKAFIDRDIKLLKIGLVGEKNVDYEIKNSKVPMICLHDIRLQDRDEVAQLDFVIITHRFIMVLETKQLNGDIYINEAGEFTRAIKNKDGNVIKKEDMYSPIVQNDRHVRILREILVRNGLIKTFSIISKVVISNPKCIINRTKAPARIKKEIFKYDQITDVLNKEMKNHEKSGEAFEDIMENVARFLVENNKNVDINYYKKYSLIEEDFLSKTIEITS